MKKLIYFTFAGLMGTSALALAQDSITLKTTDSAKIYGAGQTGQRPKGRAMITSSPETVYGTGQSSNDATAKFNLTPGHYIIGVEGEGKVSETYSLFVNPSANDPDKYLALYIENNVFRDEVGLAQIMIGAPTNNGNAIQFAPARIGLVGNIEDTSSSSKTARVLLISKKISPEATQFPYMVKGLNGATDNTLMGMRGADSNLALRSSATHNMFQWENNKKNKVVVDGNLVTEYKPGIGQDEFEMFNLNNEFGALYALTRTEYNTQTTDSGSDTSVEKFVIFLSELGATESSAKDCMLLATPRGVDQFAVRLYAPAERLGFFQKLFGFKGHSEPKLSKWSNFLQQ